MTSKVIGRLRLFNATDCDRSICLLVCAALRSSRSEKILSIEARFCLVCMFAIAFTIAFWRSPPVELFDGELSNTEECGLPRGSTSPWCPWRGELILSESSALNLKLDLQLQSRVVLLSAKLCDICVLLRSQPLELLHDRGSSLDECVVCQRLAAGQVETRK